MQKIWFTADTHFGHDAIIRHCDRPFIDAEDMDKSLIENWNSIISENQEVWHLGDFCHWDSDPEYYLESLNGRLNLVIGNHDKSEHLKIIADWVSEHDGEVVDVKYLRANGERFWLSHYAHRTWRNSHRGSYHLFGHSHGDLPPYKRSVDVGVDAWGFRPVYIDEIINLLKEEKFAHHHPR